MAVIGSRGPSVKEVAMSIALPVRRRRPAAWDGRVCRSTERSLSAFPTIVEFMAAPVAILPGAVFFASAVEKFLGEILEVGTILAREVSSVFLVMHGRDTLALGNMTVAMIFQSTIPVTLVVRAVLAVV